jgi:hypothetical protein
MSTERITQRLVSQNSKESVNSDILLKVNIDGNERLLPNNDINYIVDVAKRFDYERQSCKLYKILGTINPTVSNCLFNLTNLNNQDNEQSISVFNSNLFLDRSYPRDNDVDDDEDTVFSRAIQTFLKEQDGWFGYYDPRIENKALCVYFDMEPARERFSFLPDFNPYNTPPNSPSVKNWELTITYPESTDTGHTMVRNGLLVIDTNQVFVSTRNMTAFGVPCKHNLQTGDMVRITGTNGYDGDHAVIRVGLDNGDLKEYYFVIDLPTTGNISNNSRMKKLIDGVESKYYFRKFKKIKTKSSPVIEIDDYETYQAGFSENFFNDPIIQFVFNEEIDISDLTDNLGRPLTELYFTMVKTTSNNMFGIVKSGIEVPFIPAINNGGLIPYLQEIPVISKIHNGGNLPFVSYTPLESNVLISNSVFYGDVVEFNISTLREVVLADVNHRFNTINRELPNSINYVIGPPSTPNGPNQTLQVNLGPRQEGYYYKAHNLIKIKNLSNYIEEADPIVDEIPSYALLRNDGKYIWRDILPIGFNDGETTTLDYPFLNGSHYRYDNYCVSLKRQDPYALWGLLYTNFPSDTTGDRITDIFTVNSADDVC